MMELPLERELQSYLQRLNTAQKQSVLEMIKAFFGAGKESRISIEQYNAELDKSVAEVRAGHYINQEDIERESETW